MSKVIITSQKLVDLADAVRRYNFNAKNPMRLPEMIINASNEPGIYDAKHNMIKNWAQMINDGDIYYDSEEYDGKRPLYASANLIDERAKKIVIDDNATWIGYEGFANCTSIVKVVLPDTFTRIGAMGFAGCTSLKELVIPHKIQMDGAIFDGCSSLETFNYLTNGVILGSGTFRNCTSLSNITIPETIESILFNAFENCISLKEIIIPNSVTNISDSVFNGCTNLTKIYYKGTATGAPWGATNATVITDF